MFSHVDRIKADLFDLQQKLDQCSDTRLRKLIEAWIEAKKKLLAEHLEKENEETRNEETSKGRKKGSC
jgi:hypothetical protein